MNISRPKQAKEESNIFAFNYIFVADEIKITLKFLEFSIRIRNCICICVSATVPWD